VVVSLLLLNVTATDHGRQRRNLFKKDSVNPGEGPPIWPKKAPISFLIPKPTGSTAEMRCPARGRPNPTIRWLKDGKPLVERFLGAIDKRRWSIKLPHLIMEDNGNYTCIVQNKHGSINRTFYLDVISRRPPHAPYMLTEFKNMTFHEGANVSLTCNVASDPTVSIDWHRRIITNNTDAESQLYQHLKGSNIEGSAVFYNMTNVTEGDSGWYKCVARNSVGKSEKEAYINIIRVPTENHTLFQAQIGSDKSTFDLIVPVGVAIFIFIAMVIVVTLLVRRRIFARRNGPVIMLQPNSLYTRVPPRMAYGCLQDSKWEFSRDKLEFGGLLGQGAFGRVMKAKALGIGGREEPMIVAVKMLKGIYI